MEFSLNPLQPFECQLREKGPGRRLSECVSANLDPKMALAPVFSLKAPPNGQEKCLNQPGSRSWLTDIWQGCIPNRANAMQSTEKARFLGLCENPLNDFAVDIGQAEIPSLESVGQF